MNEAAGDLALVAMAEAQKIVPEVEVDPDFVDFDLCDIYDSITLAMIDDNSVVAPDTASTGDRGTGLNRLRRGAAGAALSAALITGVREVIEPESEVAYEEIDNGVSGGPNSFVSLLFVPNDPIASTATVRPWLAPDLNHIPRSQQARVSQ